MFCQRTIGARRLQAREVSPFDWRHIGVFNERDHRKIVVVDGRMAFVGGHCIVDSWLGAPRTARTLPM